MFNKDLPSRSIKKPLMPSPPNSLHYPMPLPSIVFLATHCSLPGNMPQKCSYEKKNLQANGNAYVPKQVHLWGSTIMGFITPLHKQNLTHSLATNYRTLKHNPIKDSKLWQFFEKLYIKKCPSYWLGDLRKSRLIPLIKMEK